MTTRRSSSSGPEPRKRQPAKTPEGREQQMVALAIDAAEKQLREGTASAQVITHYLKLGSPRERLERERLERENELLTAKVESLASGKRVEELYAKAIEAMRQYQGGAPPAVSDQDYED